MKKIIAQVANTKHDFEWYPSTDEIIGVIKKDIYSEDRWGYRGEISSPSILDCGAGDGRVLKKLTKGKKYAIEKSEALLNTLDRNIFVVGTDFDQQTLIDKKVSIVYSNPPYSQYELWASKIILEANAGLIYLVLPNRWSSSKKLKEALAIREAESEVLGTFDFLNADRKARAIVNIIRIDLSFHRSRRGLKSPKTNPFKIWFDATFSIQADHTSSSHYDLEMRKKSVQKERTKKGLVSGRDLIQVLDTLYQEEMSQLVSTYKKLESLDYLLLKEIDVNLRSVCEALELRITGLKERYWNELFNNLSTITDKLTTPSRKKLFDVLTENTHIDFTRSNAYAIVIWVLKNCNHYYDDQLTTVVEEMISSANIEAYKSNERTFKNENWRNCRWGTDVDHYKLEYRIVIHKSVAFLDDIRTVASNLGYDTQPYEKTSDFDWSSGHKNDLRCKNLRTGKEEILISARAYVNGNIHIKFHQVFLRKLNIEMGRLKGWIKDASEAACEMGIPIEEAVSAFGSNLQLGSSDIAQLTPTVETGAYF